MPRGGRSSARDGWAGPWLFPILAGAWAFGSGGAWIIVLIIPCQLLQYQYRPGTFTAWVSRLLDNHAQRRRSALGFGGARAWSGALIIAGHGDAERVSGAAI